MKFARMGLIALALLAGSPLRGADAPLQALPTLDVPAYMGTWYQVALYPNWFQRNCASDTRAQYRLLPGGAVEVLNRCRRADGSDDAASGLAKPIGTLEGERLAPAQLEVSFLPAVLRWLPFGWGRYWVVDLADDGRYAIVSEPSREYLWVLARAPQLSAEDEAKVRATLQRLGFDLNRLERHRHTPAR
jgi:apolipoprotein D and lipocalin family protein